MKQARAEALANQPRLGFRPRGSGGQQEEIQAGPGLGFGPTSVLEARKAQAQNQAPDSIPAMVKPGEFVLPPDTVHAMGGAGALQAAVDATHTPAPEEAFVPRGSKPKVFFANGGRPEDQIPTDGYPKAPAPDGSQSNPMNTELGRNVSNLANAVPGALGGSARAIARTGGAISGAINSGLNAPRALAAGAGIAGGAAASTPAAASTGVNPVPSTAPAATSTSPQATPPAGSPMGPPSSAAPQEVQPGIFRQGNSFGDSAQSAALGAQPRGLPSRQNDLAAQNLAAQSTARGFTPGQRTEVEQPRLGFPGFRAPTVAHSGNDWQARKDLQNLETGASSIMNRPEFAAAGMARFRGGGAQSGPPPAVAAYQAALQTDSALRQAQPGLDAETMRQNAGLMREDMQQSGGVQREAMQQAGETGRTGMRLGIEQQRLQGEAEARGFKTRAQRQEEQLRNTLLDPNATPQQKQQAQQSMRAIRGDADPSPWKVTVTPAVKNADGSTSQGSIIRHNSVTGEVQQVEGGGGQTPKVATQAQFDALPKGATYIGEDGRTYRKPA
ncbi:hypothetical protein N5C96_15160 [Delftia tsuruhatensis]|uniref:hypothetical protein n=1 Tax=Delftia tsuruhatensis TaxID=180282 RepID=UPI002444A84C|nr:hypothetical protein [Delftia tsuruhatensis]MDH0774735.1 hypothetical protein [Delftia tsuruhatensis]MDH1458779.1 hypothetical protein [Delftia tsuruhatensis]MDH1826879.1 hypothetical protein [Delftia tsuruhatensis]WGG09416.1 hypothetical protein N5O86_22605 [Delftia tsuruhatensis]